MGAGAIISKRDNPVISGKVTLKENVPFGDIGGGPQYFHQSTTFAPGDNSYNLYAFDLEAVSDLSQQQRLIAPSVLPGIELSLQPFPKIASGTTTAPVSIPWEVRGIKLGSSNVVAIEINKVEPDHSKEGVINLSVKIDPETIIVPIQVFRIVSTVPGTTVNQSTEHFNPYNAAWYFDDSRVIANTWSKSFPSGLKEQHVFNFQQYNHRSISEDDRPDSIFLPCRVQLRMINYQEIKVDNDERVYPKESGCQCSENGNFWAPMASANVSAVESSPNFINGVPYFIIMTRYQPADCCLSPIIAVASTSYRRAVLAGGPFTWAHEIAHVLGLDHNAGNCSQKNPAENNIMCEANSGRAITPQQCDTVREAAKLILKSTPQQFLP
jgi:hypothetical protein